MAKAYASIDIARNAVEVWQLIGGFNSLPDWLPYINASRLEEGGRVRHIRNLEGEEIVERLIAFDEEHRSYSYHILKAPFPQKDYLATLRVIDIADGRASRVEWFGQFEPVGVTDAEVTSLFKNIYEEGLAALAALFAADQQTVTHAPR
ncbi:SRPBCC family protein [Azospirillum sp. YIM B02556]|uniref:SRPBCC family protein n=1 Tax=Azospirillum endophyticum TaxID=2800326 RepID=A0ABS1EY21_9PROT|nr:SRPBCC family protein [Azospirillum endophyticum]MBK1836058.1 SRPBCC family protein [Azospirillum endophyticum]